jgi:hypothetical protein
MVFEIVIGLLIGTAIGGLIVFFVVKNNMKTINAAKADAEYRLEILKGTYNNLVSSAKGMAKTAETAAKEIVSSK